MNACHYKKTSQRGASPSLSLLFLPSVSAGARFLRVLPRKRSRTGLPRVWIRASDSGHISKFFVWVSFIVCAKMKDYQPKFIGSSKHVLQLSPSCR